MEVKTSAWSKNRISLGFESSVLSPRVELAKIGTVQDSHRFLSFGSSAGNPRNSNTCFSVSNFKLALPLVCGVDAKLNQQNEEKKRETG